MEFKNDRITSGPEESSDIVSSAANLEKPYKTKIRMISDSFDPEDETPAEEIIDLEQLSESELEKLSEDIPEARLELLYRALAK